MGKLCLLILFTAIAVSTLAEIDADTPEQLFQEGLFQEYGTGDLHAAIACYEKALQKGSQDEVLMAKTLLRLGICYEKLGRDEEAKSIYQRVVSQFPTQIMARDEAVRRLWKLLSGLVRDGQRFPSGMPGGVLLRHYRFIGGAGHVRYNHLCEPRLATWVYGKRTSFHTMRARFDVPSLPTKDSLLIIEGQDDDKAGMTNIEILINDYTLFKGPNGFVERGWSSRSYPIPRNLLKEGENTLTIRNLEDSGSANSKWFMISEAAIIGISSPE